MRDIHICPFLMRSVVWEDGKCMEQCDKDCPIKENVKDEPTE